MLLELLEESRETAKILSFWNYHESESFWCGYVKDVNEEFVIIQLITKYGKLDGVLVEKLSNIECVDFDDDYAKCMQYILKHNKELEIQSEIEPEISLTEQWQSDVLEEFVADENVIVRLTIIDDNIYSGIIKWMDSDELLLQILGPLGENKGKTILKIEDISRIRINDINNRKKLMLYKWRKNGMK